MNQTIVIIPHYNNPIGLRNSIASIDETEKIDILIIDDGSKTNNIIEEDIKGVFKAQGELIFIYQLENKGIEHVLNRGINYVLQRTNYKFIARLDSGDLCLNKRFKIQEQFLLDNPNIKMVGSNAIAVDSRGDFLYNIMKPQKHQSISRKMYLNSMFIHPSVMFNTSILQKIKGYPTNYNAAEDYAFFFAIVKQFETHNLQMFLLKYEINPSGISQTKRIDQVKNRIKIIKKNFYFGIWPIIGIIRSYILLVIPNTWLQKIKALVYTPNN